VRRKDRGRNFRNAHRPMSDFRIYVESPIPENPSKETSFPELKSKDTYGLMRRIRGAFVSALGRSRKSMSLPLVLVEPPFGETFLVHLGPSITIVR
jgi:hypothetical protein